MTSKRSQGWSSASWFVLAAALAAAGACAEGEVDFEGPETQTGAGASGGGAATGGAGGGDDSCAADCSAINAPACLKSVCNEGQYQGVVGECVVVPDPGTTCDDGMFCTIDDTCDDTGQCVGGPPNDCGMTPGQCKEIACDEDTDSCLEAPSMNGAPCQETNLCVKGSTCNNGLCSGGTLDDCFFFPVPDECHVATCNPMNGMCESQVGNEGLPCVDPMDLCTDGKTCAMGVCVGGGPKDCSSLNQGCFTGVCEPTNGQCVPQPVPPGGACADATDDCNNGICDTVGTCNPVPTNEGGPCDDNNSCTTGETCSMGSCTGGTTGTTTVYFEESFANNNAGWTIDTSWGIGPAVASGPTGSCGNGDPGQDHTATTTDNGIAGVVIGGNVPQVVTNGYLWLTSPIVNTANAPTVWVDYWRWLNSDYPSFMTNRVQVYNGSVWVDVWVQPNNFTVIADNAWGYHSFDITAHKNTQMRVRFGYEIGSSGVYLCSSWNLDDVRIVSAPCP